MNRSKPTTVYPAEVRRCVVDLVKIVKRGAFCIQKPGKSNMDTVGQRYVMSSDTWSFQGNGE